MLTPVTGFRRLLEPSLQSIPSSDVLVVAVGHRRVRSSGPISCLRHHLAVALKDLPQSLGSPSPPTCLESSGVRPRTSDTVIRPDMGLDPREPLSPRVQSPRSNLLIGRGAGYRRTVFAVSLPILVVRISPYQVPVSFGLGTSRDAASCDASPDKHHRYVRPMSASQTLDYDYPYSLASGTVRETCVSRGAMGFGTHRVDRRRGCARTPGSPLQRATFTSRSRFAIEPGMLSADTTDVANL